MTSQGPKKSFKETLNLPHTDFPIRPNSGIDDEMLLTRWETDNLYHGAFLHNKGEKKYVLHDGPPYANGPIHLGGAYNKILKDILCKSYRMAGYQVPVTPGWDCHGLPIELKVVKENPGLDRIALKRACREYANKWINVQRDSFKSLGVLMDWNNYYSTMDPKYEADTVRAFGILVEKEFIERKNKTVPWCFYDQTVLASAEIEYKDRKDPSVYVLFDLKDSDAQSLFAQAVGHVSIAVWTTTPWTLPLNKAVLAKTGATYVLLDINGRFVIAGEHIAGKLCYLLGIDKKVLRTFNADYLTNVLVKNPVTNALVPIIFDESVSTEEGTAFVHCAPGAGPLDYEIGIKNKLPIYSPITADGKYTQDIDPKELKGMSIQDGQIWVIKNLAENNRLLYKGSITHSYPHCWRCHNGLIFRATPQWFFDLEKGIKQKALGAIDNIKFIPENSRNFLKATIESRWEWCLSRQRVWGTPIPALLCKNCDYAYISKEFIEKVAHGIEAHGIEYWDAISIKDVMPNNLVCPNCKVSDFEKEQDILDVWFDSGVSHYAVLYNNPNLSYPADIYVEGVDQHRGWFQSSLLMSLVLEEEPCAKSIMTHGYVVDAKGQKMSKSVGNVVAPEDIVKQLGTDGLRLWVASIGHDSDPIVSEVLLRNIAEVYRKIRNTCRFLLSNLYDFSIEHNSIQSERLLPLDHYALVKLDELNNHLINKYSEADFTAVFHGLAEYCSVELSSFYLDIVKDRLYVEKADGLLRRSAQTVLWHTLDTITHIMAPIMSFTAEHVSDYYQKDKKSSIHLQSFIDSQSIKKLYHKALESEPLWPGVGVRLGSTAFTAYNFEIEQKLASYNRQWDILKDVRSAILKAIEIEREKGLIKHSLEAHVALYINLDNEKYKPLKTLFELFESQGQNITSFFKEFLIVSQFSYATNKDNLNLSSLPDVYVKVDNAQGVKCPRCWQWDMTSNPDDLCARCERVLSEK